MKILNPNEAKFNKLLADAMPGNVVEFLKVPHVKHAAESIFLVLRVPSQYLVEKERFKLGNIVRTLVANLETGACSLVSQDRSMRFVKAEVTKL